MVNIWFMSIRKYWHFSRIWLFFCNRSGHVVCSRIAWRNFHLEFIFAYFPSFPNIYKNLEPNNETLIHFWPILLCFTGKSWWNPIRLEPIPLQPQRRPLPVPLHNKWWLRMWQIFTRSLRDNNRTDTSSFQFLRLWHRSYEPDQAFDAHLQLPRPTLPIFSNVLSVGNWRNYPWRALQKCLLSYFGHYHCHCLSFVQLSWILFRHRLRFYDAHKRFRNHLFLGFEHRYRHLYSFDRLHWTQRRFLGARHPLLS